MLRYLWSINSIAPDVCEEHRIPREEKNTTAMESNIKLLETFGNNIPALLKLQGVLELISPEVLYSYLSLATKFEFQAKPN